MLDPCHARTTLAAWLFLAAACSGGSEEVSPTPAGDPPLLPIVTGVPAQPLRVMVGRLRQALAVVGAPLSSEVSSSLDRILEDQNDEAFVREVQRLLDRACLVGVRINPESRTAVLSGPAPRRLIEAGWSVFLVKVYNEASVQSVLEAHSPQALPLRGSDPGQVGERWLQIDMFDEKPLEERLSGLLLEYRILLLYSRDAGQRAAVLSFGVGPGTTELGFRSESLIVFDCVASTPVTLRVRDQGGRSITGGFVIRDQRGRVYPSQAKRLAPDFDFQPQIYRTDGETIRLPPGRYRIEATHGPETEPIVRDVDIGTDPVELTFDFERWVEPLAYGYWSGDHHIHAAGCSHYDKPTEGVLPEDLVVHCRGEDLHVGVGLTWSKCFDYQSQFFSGAVHKASVYPHLLRYDLEVSGFGSSPSGHLCLLRLREQSYPGSSSLSGWPTLGLNTLRWAKLQDAVCGTAHSGHGLWVDSQTLPNYEIPPFDGIGANEYIVDVTHEVPGPNGTVVPAIDFVSTCDTPAAWELNIWYHTLNCGYRPRIAGETDFPCLSDRRVGAGRSYVKVEGTLGFDEWAEGIRRGRSYVSDGRSHLIDFTVGGVEVGTAGSEVRLAAPGRVVVTAQVAALLPEDPDPAIGKSDFRRAPYWHLERARIDDSREVPVELVVNGEPAAAQRVLADGRTREVRFEMQVAKSSWVALRIFPSSHTNPVFVLVGGEPIRASKRSAKWCLDSVDQCWHYKSFTIAPGEMQDAIDAYEHARESYRRILRECTDL